MGIKKWFKSQLFGGKILRTVGSVRGENKLPRTELRVHVIEDKEGPANFIGIELVAKSLASYQTMPVKISVEEAKQLIDLLNSAIQ